MDWGVWPKHLRFTSHRYHEMGSFRKYPNRKQLRKAAGQRGFVLHYLSNKGNYVAYHWEGPRKPAR